MRHTQRSMEPGTQLPPIRRTIRGLAVLAAAFLLASCGEEAGTEEKKAAEKAAPAETGTAADARKTGADIDTARIAAAEKEPENWLAHGRTYSEQRFSPLKQINTQTVSKLGLAWYADLNTQRGVEATPIVVDGVMYVSGPWSVVWAFDARTGEELWFYDPEVPKAWGQKACCGTVNRGVAVYEGDVFVGTLDGYLVSLDAETGKENWKINTIDREKPYTITGAPRVVKGKVLIGNGGAEYGVRGYLSAYDAKSGDLAWRFYTVPGDPEKPVEHEELKEAAKTWDPSSEYWKIGGGGTVWDSLAYDPELDLLYVGVGNGSPWARHVRSPGGGDNLFLSSILALRPDTGEMVWHYQTTPGDNWDYTATQHMILADIELYGETRKVLMQAPKNGFFYVLDRETGELLKADKYVKATWASHVNLATGRPVETEAGQYAERPSLVFPSPLGGHNWQPMAYSPQTNLVYIPAMEAPSLYEPMQPQFQEFEGWWNTGTQTTLTTDVPPEMMKGHVLAWDPVRGRAAWAFQHWGHWNGGMLATAGGLVFQGGGDGLMRAFNAETGDMLWSAPAQTGIIASPVTYEIDGQQYVTIAAGWGGAGALTFGRASRAAGVRHIGRILTFKLGADKQLPPLPDAPEIPEPPEPFGTPEQVEQGKLLYHGFCAQCHGIGVVGGGVIPDLRHSERQVHERWKEIVLEGERADAGMAGFSRWLGEAEAQAIHAYVVKRANEGEVPGTEE
ncbi:MAG: PQQ-dependent dehydrogenase, methanol/ethanol family [Alphaproteobacteria bacterium]